MYRMDNHTADEMIARDPFVGHGLFLAGAEQDTLEAIFGLIPAVGFPGQGAWIDLDGAGVTAQDALARWKDAGHAPPE